MKKVRLVEAEEFTGFYIEKTDLIDYAQTEEQAKEMVAKLSAQNQNDCVYKYSSAVPKENPTEEEIAEFIKASFQILVGFDKYKMMDYILESKFRIVPTKH